MTLIRAFGLEIHEQAVKPATKTGRVVASVRAGRLFFLRPDGVEIESGVPLDNSVNTNRLVNLAVTTAKIAAAAVDGTKVAAAAIAESHLADLAVTTGKLANSAVTTAKVADSAVTLAKLGLNTLQHISYEADLAAKAVVPVGSVHLYAGGSTPLGFLECDGLTAYSRTTYPDLYDRIGLLYTTGNDGATFRTPDLRDRVPVGASSSKALASKGGSDQLPGHSHTFAFRSSSNTAIGGTSLRVADIQGLLGAVGGTSTTASTDSAGSGSSSNIQNPYLALHYIIKY